MSYNAWGKQPNEKFIQLQMSRVIGLQNSRLYKIPNSLKKKKEKIIAMRLASPSTLQLLCNISEKAVSRHQRLTDTESKKIQVL